MQVLDVAFLESKRKSSLLAMIKISVFLNVLFVVTTVLITKTFAEEAECPKDWLKEQVTGDCYYASPVAATHRFAVSKCKKMGSYLASAKNMREETFLRQQLTQIRSNCRENENCKEFWFGLHKFQGKWVWMDESKGDIQLWHMGYPFEGDGDCGLISLDDNSEGYLGAWKNEKCDRALRFVCQSKCPAGFFYAQEADNCYRIISEKLSWEEAWEKCPELNPKANLIIFSSELESENAINYLATRTKKEPNFCAETRRKAVFWVGAKRPESSDCKSPVVWYSAPHAEKEIPMTYTNWNVKEPKCQKGLNTCIQMEQAFGYKWSEKDCEMTRCSLCELTPTKAHPNFQ